MKTHRAGLFILPVAGTILLGLCRVASATDQITWSGSPTPVTLSHFEVAVTPHGRLISWRATGERNIQGYRVQARRPGGSWAHASPLIIAERVGTEGHFYAWQHYTSAHEEYRLAEIYEDGMVEPLDATDTSRKRSRPSPGPKPAIGSPPPGETPAKDGQGPAPEGSGSNALLNHPVHISADADHFSLWTLLFGLPILALVWITAYRRRGKEHNTH